jgi:hypothetical protein
MNLNNSSSSSQSILACNSIKILAVLLSLAFLLPGLTFADMQSWREPGQKFKPVSVTFVVTEGKSRNPIANAVVKINRESKYTDNHGKVTFNRPDIFEVSMVNDKNQQMVPCDGRYTGGYTVSMGGYDDQSGELALSCSAPCTTIHVQMRKIRAARQKSHNDESGQQNQSLENTRTSVPQKAYSGDSGSIWIK